MVYGREGEGEGERRRGKEGEKGEMERKIFPPWSTNAPTTLVL